MGRHHPLRTLRLTTPALAQAVHPHAPWPGPPCQRQATPYLRVLLMLTLDSTRWCRPSISEHRLATRAGCSAGFQGHAVRLLEYFVQGTSQSACKRESFPRIAQLFNATKSESVAAPVDDVVSAIGARNMRSNSARFLLSFGELFSFALSACP